MIIDIDEYNRARDRTSNNLVLFDSYTKAKSVLEKYNSVCVSVSGGKDSDLCVDIVSRLDKEKKARYIWFNTGLEYQATKDHLVYLEKRYGITIERIPAIKPIPLSCKEYGVPFLSKYVSEMLYRLQEHSFQFEDEDLTTLENRYSNCLGSLKWWTNDRDVTDYGYSQFNISYNKFLKEFMLVNPPDFSISSKCCKYAKKDVAHKFAKENSIGLMVTGIRKAEGGIRSSKYKGCFDADNGNYRPLFRYTNADEKAYDELFGIKHSDCYEQWGFTRTGCVGCPYNKKFYEEEEEVIQEKEPKMYKAIQNIFGKSYEYTRRYRRFQKAGKEGKLITIGKHMYCLDDLLEPDYHIREDDYDSQRDT